MWDQRKLLNLAPAELCSRRLHKYDVDWREAGRQFLWQWLTIQLRKNVRWYYSFAFHVPMVRILESIHQYIRGAGHNCQSMDADIPRAGLRSDCGPTAIQGPTDVMAIE